MTIAVALNPLHCRVVLFTAAESREDAIRVLMSQATVLSDVSSAAVKIVNDASVTNDQRQVVGIVESGEPRNFNFLETETKSGTVNYMW